MTASEFNFYIYVVLFVSELGIIKFSSLEVSLYFATILYITVLGTAS